MLDLKQLAESEELFDGHYKLLNPLNTEGATADIWLAVDTNTVDYYESDILDKEPGLKVAIKIYRPQNALDIEGLQRFRKEFKVVFDCQHSNLLHPVHFSIYKDIPYLVLPYCKNGSSELLIGQLRSDEDIWNYIYDVASGLNYLHTNNPPIIHQDIKPANILIDNKKHYTITDFGISITPNSMLSDEDNIGTLAYMAPERFLEVKPTIESDIWSFGATLYELITGQVPFGEEGGKKLLSEESPLEFPPIKLSKSIRKLICACLDRECSNRPSAAELIKSAELKTFPIDNKRKYIRMMLISLLFLGIPIIWHIYHIQNDPPLLSSSAINGHLPNDSLQKSENVKSDSTIMLKNTEEQNTSKTLDAPIIPIKIKKAIKDDGSAFVKEVENRTNYSVKITLFGNGKRFKTLLEPGQISFPKFVCSSIRYSSKNGSGILWEKDNSHSNKLIQSGCAIKVNKEIKLNGMAYVSSIENISNGKVAVRIFIEDNSILYLLEPGDIVSPYRSCTKIAYGDKNGWKTYWEIKS